MSVFTSESPTPRTPEQVAATVASNIKDTAKQTYQLLLSTQRSGIRTLWKNQNATPQQICDALGTDAGKVFAGHGALTDLLVKLGELEGVQAPVALPTNAFTVASDGKVTILEGPYVPPS